MKNESERLQMATYDYFGRAVESGLANLVVEYFRYRKLTIPSVESAFEFLVTEVGEVVEEKLQFEGGWVRNNKDKEQPLTRDEYLNRLGKELSDVIMMAIVMGLVAGVDPVRSLMDHKAIGFDNNSIFDYEQFESLASNMGVTDFSSLLKPPDKFKTGSMTLDGKYTEYGDESEDDPYHGEGIA